MHGRATMFQGWEKLCMLYPLVCIHINCARIVGSLNSRDDPSKSVFGTYSHWRVARDIEETCGLWVGLVLHYPPLEENMYFLYIT